MKKRREVSRRFLMLHVASSAFTIKRLLAAIGDALAFNT